MATETNETSSNPAALAVTRPVPLSVAVPYSPGYFTRLVIDLPPEGAAA